jgi:capsular polysaccharide transport system permease protein
MMKNSPKDGSTAVAHSPARPELRAVHTPEPAAGREDPDTAARESGTGQATSRAQPVEASGERRPESAEPGENRRKDTVRELRRQRREERRASRTGDAGDVEAGAVQAGAVEASTVEASTVEAGEIKAGAAASPRARGADVAATLAAPEPEVGPARIRPRHWVMLASFVLVIVLPLALTAGYLWTRAADQYHSEVAFSIRSEEATSAAAGLIGAITNIGTGSATDADILFEYIRSQKIVEELDRELDLRTIYNRPRNDPVFTLGGNATMEDLVAYWRRMVTVSFETANGIIHVRADAFTPEDAQAISSAILARSSALVNQLADQAREDAIRYAREELDEAEENLRLMRARLAEFRRANRMVDPTADAAGQSGLLNALQNQLAQALVERDVLLTYAGEGDQRVVQANRRIDAITARIEEERTSLGVVGVEGALPDVIGAYEELRVDLEFANTTYTQALAALSAARAEARRQSRYLAPHIQPTRAESPLYPRRLLLSGLTGLFLLLGWGVLMLIYYNVRDNR